MTGAVSFSSLARWGFESAALDLALRQARLSLSAGLGRPARPVRFVVSTRLGSPPDDCIVRKWLEFDPSLGFKLDAESSWTFELVTFLAAAGRVQVVGLQGF